MSQSAGDVERLLREAGIAVPARQNRPSVPARKRGPLSRLLDWLRWRLLILLLLIAFAVVSDFLFTTGTATDPYTPQTGNSFVDAAGAFRPDPRFGIVEAFRAPSQAATVDIGWERMVFWWSALQKNGPDSWDAFATDHDREIDAELQLGRHIAGLLINTPDWAAANPAKHGTSPPQGLYLPFNDPKNYWGHFVGLIARRYAGRIDDWIIWNEVNIPSGQFHTWAGSNADYAQLVKVAYQAAKAANPHARIALAGDPYWYDHGALFRDLLRRLAQGPQARANNDYFDVVNLHIYSRPTDIARIVELYRTEMRRAGISKPIMIGETNAIPYNDSLRPYSRGNFRASLDDQASFVVQAFAIALAEGVERIEINRMLDGSDFAQGGEPFGLVRNDGTARPGLYGYRTAAALFAGVTGGTINFNPWNGVYMVILKRPDAVVSVLWDQWPTPVQVRLPARSGTAAVYDKFGQRTVVHARQGAFTLSLKAATGNTNSANPKDYVVGGSPLIVIQSIKS